MLVGWNFQPSRHRTQRLSPGHFQQPSASTVVATGDFHARRIGRQSQVPAFVRVQGGHAGDFLLDVLDAFVEALLDQGKHGLATVGLFVQDCAEGLRDVNFRVGDDGVPLGVGAHGAQSPPVLAGLAAKLSRQGSVDDDFGAVDQPHTCGRGVLQQIFG